jgi:hypothetical protein
MANNKASKITKDTSARKNTPVGSIHSAIEAAATKKSYDCYVNSLTEGYKRQLETMEQGYEKQIQNLERAAAKATNKHRAAEEEHEHTLTKYHVAKLRASKAKDDKNDLEVRYLAQIKEQTRKHKAELEKVRRAKSSGSCQHTEIKFTKRLKSRMGKSEVAIKKSDAMFHDLAQTVLSSGSVHRWTFEYQGRPLTGMEKTLTQVSCPHQSRAC